MNSSGSAILPAAAKRCAIYTRKSTDEGLDTDFSSLDAQRASCSSYIASQKHEGWIEVVETYDDGGFSGGSLQRPAFQRLLTAVNDGLVDIIVVYKVDRLTRSLLDFARIVDALDARGASFVSVTQSFNSTTSMGRLTLNVLLSFAQFEREVASERVRDKIAASKAKGIWMGGTVPLGYDVCDRQLVINEAEAMTVRRIFDAYVGGLSGVELTRQLDADGVRSKSRIRKGMATGGGRIYLGALYGILKNPLYAGKVSHRGVLHAGRHEPIVSLRTFEMTLQKLKSCGVRRRSGLDAKEPSPLAGLITDTYNRRMIPSHTQRSGRRYRYYVSQDKIGIDEKPVWRVSANEIERSVTEQLITAFRFAGDDISERDCINDLNERAAIIGSCIQILEGGQSPDASSLIRSVVSNIFVTEQDVTVCGSFDERLGDTQLSPFRLRASMKSVRRGKSVNLLLPPPGSDVPASAGLSKLIAQAFSLRRKLEQGQSLNAVASLLRIHPDYVTELTRVAYLAPSIQAAMVEGTQPDSFTRKSIMEASCLPLRWDEQRAALKF